MTTAVRGAVEAADALWRAIDNIEGWLHPMEAWVLHEEVRQIDRIAPVVVEIGSWKGRSALSLRSTTRGPTASTTCSATGSRHGVDRSATRAGWSTVLSSTTDQTLPGRGSTSAPASGSSPSCSVAGSIASSTTARRVLRD